MGLGRTVDTAVNKHIEYAGTTDRRPHWNELLPGDAFSFTERHNDRPFQITYSFQSKPVNVLFYANVTYLVVSRRRGGEFPYPRDYYVFLGAGLSLGAEYLL